MTRLLGARGVFFAILFVGGYLAHTRSFVRCLGDVFGVVVDAQRRTTSWKRYAQATTIHFQVGHAQEHQIRCLFCGCRVCFLLFCSGFSLLSRKPLRRRHTARTGLRARGRPQFPGPAPRCQGIPGESAAGGVPLRPAIRLQFGGGVVGGVGGFQGGVC